ncbi:uncharacterized protein LOC112344841 [Selaginella moellendorffii]|uniref:uncharacterized protein LOC112344841 n=1 Tax=Selaginella moellendorffii TaxID=88036 RepID=UPI000D1C582B|nr:uncharacterized protein LOC112344841 [Selaginella moellendorffii]|eukprot:XP_024526079.1 uncharacterized protein LOC112344841 [Selaginella moellendorffii]
MAHVPGGEAPFVDLVILVTLASGCGEANVVAFPLENRREPHSRQFQCVVEAPVLDPRGEREITGQELLHVASSRLSRDEAAEIHTDVLPGRVLVHHVLVRVKLHRKRVVEAPAGGHEAEDASGWRSPRLGDDDEGESFSLLARRLRDLELKRGIEGDELDRGVGMAEADRELVVDSSDTPWLPRGSEGEGDVVACLAQGECE